MLSGKSILMLTGPGVLLGGEVIVNVFEESTWAEPRFAPYQTSGVREKALPKPPKVAPPTAGPGYGDMCCRNVGLPGALVTKFWKNPESSNAIP